MMGGMRRGQQGTGLAQKEGMQKIIFHQWKTLHPFWKLKIQHSFIFFKHPKTKGFFPLGTFPIHVALQPTNRTGSADVGKMVLELLHLQSLQTRFTPCWPCTAILPQAQGPAAHLSCTAPSLDPRQLPLH